MFPALLLSSSCWKCSPTATSSRSQPWLGGSWLPVRPRLGGPALPRPEGDVGLGLVARVDLGAHRAGDLVLVRARPSLLAVGRGVGPLLGRAEDGARVGFLVAEDDLHLAVAVATV